jgi:hypothetical protein
MDEPQVRERAQALCEALVSGNVDLAIDELSDELRRNLGEVLALLPLPATDVSIESVERGGSGFNVVIRLVGETSEDRVQTRWKDRDGTPKVVEMSHVSRTVRAAEEAEAEAGAEAIPEGEAAPGEA